MIIFITFAFMKKDDFPKVLVGAPQHESKNYCFKEWLENVKNFTYPNFDIFLADNSNGKDNYNMLLDNGVKAEWIRKNKNGLLFRINDAHNAVAEYTLRNNYEYLLHLETDIFPPIDVIERLLVHNKKVVGGLYDIFYGKKRKLMAQLDEDYSRHIRAYRTVDFVESLEPVFFDGTLKQVYHAGIGCMLIHRDILEQIPFRVTKGNNFHSDTWFANDCAQLDIPIYVDTDLMCEHKNFTWLTVIEELKDYKSETTV